MDGSRPGRGIIPWPRSREGDEQTIRESKYLTWIMINKSVSVSFLCDVSPSSAIAARPVSN